MSASFQEWATLTAEISRRLTSQTMMGDKNTFFIPVSKNKREETGKK